MDNNKEEKVKWTPSPVGSAMFLFGVAGVASVGGFSMVLAKSRKASPGDFDKGVVPEKNMESGAKLAMRALRRATLYSVGGFSLFCFSVWKLMGVNNLQEFTAKMQSKMPKVPPAKTGDGKDIDWDELFETKKPSDPK